MYNLLKKKKNTLEWKQDKLVEISGESLMAAPKPVASTFTKALPFTLLRVSTLPFLFLNQAPTLLSVFQPKTNSTSSPVSFTFLFLPFPN